MQVIVDIPRNLYDMVMVRQPFDLSYGYQLVNCIRKGRVIPKWYLGSAIKCLYHDMDWIPVSDPEMEIPKDGNTYWVTRKSMYGNQCFYETDTVFWDIVEWSDQIADVIAYMRYKELEPYRDKRLIS